MSLEDRWHDVRYRISRRLDASTTLASIAPWRKVPSEVYWALRIPANYWTEEQTESVWVWLKQISPPSQHVARLLRRRLIKLTADSKEDLVATVGWRLRYDCLPRYNPLLDQRQSPVASLKKFWLRQCKEEFDKALRELLSRPKPPGRLKKWLMNVWGRVVWLALRGLARVLNLVGLVREPVAAGKYGETTWSAPRDPRSNNRPPPATDVVPRNPTEGNGDWVYCSVFGPRTLKRERHALIQAYVHLPDAAPEAIARASEFDDEASRLGYKALGARVEADSLLSFTLRCAGLEIDDPIQTLRWRRHTSSVSFGVFMPDTAQRTFIGTVVVAVSGIL